MSGDILGFPSTQTAHRSLQQAQDAVLDGATGSAPALGPHPGLPWALEAFLMPWCGGHYRWLTNGFMPQQPGKVWPE